MGTNLGKIIEPRKIQISQLKGKVVVVDAHNILYQFLTVIRNRDGTLLRNSRDEVISHILGLLPRVANWLSDGIRPAFIFDGSPPDLKMGTIRERYKTRSAAFEKFQEAKAEGDISQMKKYGIRSTHLTDQILDSSMKLLREIGIPVIEAPSEADAQMAHMTIKKDAYAAVTQDYDPLLHGATRLVRNLSKSQRNKRGLQLVVLEDVLADLSLTHKELVALAIMMGTDYKPGGIYGIGPKRGQKLLKENDIDEAFENAGCEFDWRKIMKLFLEMPVTDDYDLAWKAPDAGKLREVLIEDLQLSERRVEKRVPQIIKAQAKNEQHSEER